MWTKGAFDLEESSLITIVMCMLGLGTLSTSIIGKSRKMDDLTALAHALNLTAQA